MRWVLTGVAVAAILAGLTIGANIAWWYYRSDTVGHALVKRESRAIEAHRRAANKDLPATSCPSFSDGASSVQGLVEAPVIGMNAPVLAGTGDPQLDVAVGHLMGSSWPGQPGTTLLAAHDVSYFSHIDGLRAGDTVDFATPCSTYVYRVTNSEVVPTGSPVYSSPSQALLVLETCYPLNALYQTAQRYLVIAQFQGTEPVGQSGKIPTLEPPPRVPAPPDLVSQGLTLATNDTPLGTLTLQGLPSPTWQQSPGPIDDESAVLAEYFAGLRSAEEGRADWWSTIASVDEGSARLLDGASISEYHNALSPALSVGDQTLSGAQLTAIIDVQGGAAPGRYALVVGMVVFDGTLVIDQWTMTPTA